jgi:signal transduction histidine kinase
MGSETTMAAAIVYGAGGEAEDVLEQMGADERRRLGALLANVSHELRTPLTGVLAMAEALQTETYGTLNERQQHLLQRIEHSGRHLLDVINELLDLSRLDAGTFDLVLTDCMLEPLCRACVQCVAPLAAAKRQSVHLCIEPQSLQIVADGRRLRQMLRNLLENAVKFTPEGGALGLHVTVGDASNPPVVRFVVWDTGSGIPLEEQSKLFQPFTQLDSSLTRRHSGTGLGLVLVKRIAELHGGHVGVESAPGQGSRFHISLPWSLHQEAHAGGGV